MWLKEGLTLSRRSPRHESAPPAGVQHGASFSRWCYKDGAISARRFFDWPAGLCGLSDGNETIYRDIAEASATDKMCVWPLSISSDKHLSAS